MAVTNDVLNKATDGLMFCCHGNVKFGPQYYLILFFILLNCKYTHLYVLSRENLH